MLAARWLGAIPQPDRALVDPLQPLAAATAACERLFVSGDAEGEAFVQRRLVAALLGGEVYEALRKGREV